jgi:hypothetical protein
MALARMIHLLHDRRMPLEMRNTQRREPDFRWLVLIHQIPPKPAYLRVKIGRRLQRLGAAAIKNSVYVLPRTDQAYEDFGWIAREVVEGGGEASVCEARFVDGLSDDSIEALFHAARDADYAQLASDARSLQASLRRAKKIDGRRREETEAALARLRKRLAEVVAIDFFGASGREIVEGLLEAIAERIRNRSPGEAVRGPREQPTEVRGRIWVTRKGVHIDRIASAWLIRRFIDPEARFKFVSGRGYHPEPDELRFDMFEAEFTHQGDCCTFEVLLQRFCLEDMALRSIAQAVHDIDVKDGKYSRQDAPGIERVVTGITLSKESDEARLALGSEVFDGLYEHFRRKRN